jgi:hypothetical protein
VYVIGVIVQVSDKLLEFGQFARVGRPMSVQTPIKNGSALVEAVDIGCNESVISLCEFRADIQEIAVTSLGNYKVSVVLFGIRSVSHKIHPP